MYQVNFYYTTEQIFANRFLGNPSHSPVIARSLRRSNLYLEMLDCFVASAPRNDRDGV